MNMVLSLLAHDAISGVLNTIKDGIRDFAVDIINVGATFETLAGRLKAVSVSQEAANRAMNWIINFTATTPFQLDEVVNAFTNLQLAGLDAREILPKVGDAIATLGTGGEGVNRVVGVLAQMANKGKLVTEEIMQLNEAGIPAFAILKEELKLSTDQMANIAGAGISVDKAIKAITDGMGKRFGGAMQTAAQSWKGLTSNLEDEWTLMKKALADAGLFDIAKEGLIIWLSMVNKVRVAVEDFARSEWPQVIGMHLNALLSVMSDGIGVVRDALYGLYEAGAFVYDLITTRSLKQASALSAERHAVQESEKAYKQKGETGKTSQEDLNAALKRATTLQDSLNDAIKAEEIAILNANMAVTELLGNLESFDLDNEIGATYKDLKNDIDAINKKYTVATGLVEDFNTVSSEGASVPKGNVEGLYVAGYVGEWKTKTEAVVALESAATDKLISLYSQRSESEISRAYETYKTEREIILKTETSTVQKASKLAAIDIKYSKAFIESRMKELNAVKDMAAKSLDEHIKYADKVLELDKKLKDSKVALTDKLRALDRDFMSEGEAQQDLWDEVREKGYAAAQAAKSGDLELAQKLLGESESLSGGLDKKVMGLERMKELYIGLSGIQQSITEKEKADAQTQANAAEQRYLKEMEVAEGLRDSMVGVADALKKAMEIDRIDLVVGTEQAKAALDNVKAQIDQIREQASQPINLQVATSTVEGHNTGGVAGWSIVPGSGNTDSVAAMLTPGEHIVRKDRANRFRPWLHLINAGSEKQASMLESILSRALYFNAGGMVPAMSNNAAIELQPLIVAINGSRTAPIRVESSGAQELIRALKDWGRGL